VKALIDNSINIVAMRDATRGGVSATLNEWATQSSICIEIDEDKLLVSDEVRGVCEFLGFEPTVLANEGTFCLAVKKSDEKKALEILKKFNKNSSIIGRVTKEYPKKVVLKSSYGTKRFLEMPTGELLPRIC
jgi:hydrogenase expression/formation protein HypE